MTMVERVARALCVQHYEKRFGPIKGNPHAPHIMMNVEGNWHMFVDPARAAIEAMKEPTPEMTSCNEDVASAWGYSCHVCGGPKKAWDDMIQAALEEGE